MFRQGNRTAPAARRARAPANRRRRRRRLRRRRRCRRRVGHPPRNDRCLFARAEAHGRAVRELRRRRRAARDRRDSHRLGLVEPGGPRGQRRRHRHAGRWSARRCGNHNAPLTHCTPAWRCSRRPGNGRRPWCTRRASPAVRCRDIRRARSISGSASTIPSSEPHCTATGRCLRYPIGRARPRTAAAGCARALGRSELAHYPVRDNERASDGTPFTGVNDGGDGLTIAHHIAFQLDAVKFQYGCFARGPRRCALRTRARAARLAPRPAVGPGRPTTDDRERSAERPLPARSIAGVEAAQSTPRQAWRMSGSSGIRSGAAPAASAAARSSPR